jgi:hypothetical protein
LRTSDKVNRIPEVIGTSKSNCIINKNSERGRRLHTKKCTIVADATRERIEIPSQIKAKINGIKRLSRSDLSKLHSLIEEKKKAKKKRARARKRKMQQRDSIRE